jgi:hypothetical protein
MVNSKKAVPVLILQPGSDMDAHAVTPMVVKFAKTTSSWLVSGQRSEF